MARSLKAGDRIGEYELLTDMSSENAGTCLWAIASSDTGERSFIKQYLSPIWPSDEAPGSARRKAQHRAEFARFEAHLDRVEARLANVCPAELVVPGQAFFRTSGGSNAVKVTRALDPVDPAFERHDRETRFAMMALVAASVAGLSDVNMVHGDLRPENVMWESGPMHPVPRLIDFDLAMLVDTEDGSYRIGGDPLYWSPELRRLATEEGEGGIVSDRSDVFALGLMLHLYEHGTRPEAADFESVAEAIEAGRAVAVSAGSDAVGRRFARLIEGMLEAEPARRPSAAEVHAELRELRRVEGGLPVVARRSREGLAFRGLSKVGPTMRKPAPAVVRMATTLVSSAPTSPRAGASGAIRFRGVTRS